MGSDKFVAGCSKGCCPSQAEHFRSVLINKPTPQAQLESAFAKDREAYRRLRQNGLQPPRIDGCAVLEKHARTKAEIETGSVIWKKGEVCRPSQMTS